MKINQSLLRRIEALEKREGECVVAFLDRSADPITGEALPVDGWTVVAVTKPWPEPVIGEVWRQDGENCEQLEARARDIGTRHGGVVACYPAREATR